MWDVMKLSSAPGLIHMRWNLDDTSRWSWKHTHTHWRAEQLLLDGGCFRRFSNTFHAVTKTMWSSVSHFLNRSLCVCVCVWDVKGAERNYWPWFGWSFFFVFQNCSRFLSGSVCLWSFWRAWEVCDGVCARVGQWMSVKHQQQQLNRLWIFGCNWISWQ